MFRESVILICTIQRHKITYQYFENKNCSILPFHNETQKLVEFCTWQLWLSKNNVAKTETCFYIAFSQQLGQFLYWH